VSEPSHLFADRLLNIAVTGHLVRLQWGVMKPPQAEGEKPVLQPSQTLVLPIDGLLTSLDMIEGLVRRLVKDGGLNPPGHNNPPPQPMQ